MIEWLAWGLWAARWSAAADLNGDGHDDLLVGVPFEDIGNVADAGMFHALLGSRSGLVTATATGWHQDSSSVNGVAELGDRFGAALATGDFDGDGFDDVAVGAPSEDVGSSFNAGVVNVMFGGPAGVSGTGDQEIDLADLGLGALGTQDNQLGTAIAAGDFDGDGFDDLAIGVPARVLSHRVVVGWDTIGAVYLAFGSPAGIQSATLPTELSEFVSPTDCGFQPYGGIWDAGFGAVLAAGDFDGDGVDDLAIGSPDCDTDGLASAGQVTVVYSPGLTPNGGQAWDQGPLEGLVEAGDRFGAALAVGDFDGDGFDDLAIGAPDEDAGSTADTGVVHLLFGGASGLVDPGDDGFDQSLVGGVLSAHDRFGAALAAGDVDGDGFDDLAIGSPDENWNGVVNSGVVHLLFGEPTGVFATAMILHQDTPGIGPVNEVGDRYGAALTLGDYDGDGFDDLVVAAPTDGIGAAVSGGWVNVVYGGSTGLTTAGNQEIHQNVLPGVTVESHDQFGLVLR